MAKIELTKEQISTIKEALRHGIHRISEYPHHTYESRRASLKPLEEALSALPDLRSIKE